MKISSFPPISTQTAKALILGSMPGEASLQANQYYAHPRNLFWPIMASVFKSKPLTTYEDRLVLLLKNDIALWDVLQHCERDGSLDSSIRHEVPNDFETFLEKHPSITHIFFNGQKARNSFKKWVQPRLRVDRYSFYTLPSTSPANASWSFARKCECWQMIVDNAPRGLPVCG